MTPEEWNKSEEYGEMLFIEYDDAKTCIDVVISIVCGLGVFGNTMAIISLITALGFQTPHYFAYRVVAIAELIYCLTYFIVRIVDSHLRYHDAFTLVYKTETAAVFQILIRPLISSTMGYIVLYMRIYISMDRFVAIWCPSIYQGTSNPQKYKIARISFLCVLFLSFVVHSWKACVQKRIAPVLSGELTLYESTYRLSPQWYVDFRNASDTLNLLIRISYPIVLVVLMAFVMVGFIKFKKKRSFLRNRATTDNDQCDSDRRKERSLFYLLIATVLLAFVQMIPREIRRVTDYLYPSICQHLNDQAISYEDRINNIDNCLTSKWLMVIGNLTTTLDRSIKFYLYFLLNQQYRKTVRNGIRTPYLLQRFAPTLICTRETDEPQVLTISSRPKRESAALIETLV